MCVVFVMQDALKKVLKPLTVDVKSVQDAHFTYEQNVDHIMVRLINRAYIYKRVYITDHNLFVTMNKMIK